MVVKLDTTKEKMEVKKMKKNILEKTGKVLSTVAKAAVLIEVNSTCPFAVYQPKLPESVEKMRKK